MRNGSVARMLQILSLPHIAPKTPHQLDNSREQNKSAPRRKDSAFSVYFTKRTYAYEHQSETRDPLKDKAMRKSLRNPATQADLSRPTDIFSRNQLGPDLSLVLGLELVVLGDVAVEGAHHDHGHHAREEEHDHERVDDGEPVDLVVGHQQVCVPAGCPLDVADLQPGRGVGLKIPINAADCFLQLQTLHVSGLRPQKMHHIDTTLLGAHDKGLPSR